MSDKRVQSKHEWNNTSLLQLHHLYRLLYRVNRWGKLWTTISYCDYHYLYDSMHLRTGPCWPLTVNIQCITTVWVPSIHLLWNLSTHWSIHAIIYFNPPILTVCSILSKLKLRIKEVGNFIFVHYTYSQWNFGPDIYSICTSKRKTKKV